MGDTTPKPNGLELRESKGICYDFSILNELSNAANTTQFYHNPDQDFEVSRP